MITFRSVAPRVIAVLLLFAVTGCEKDPIEAVLEETLDFSGVYQATDGTEIVVEGDDAVITRVGSSPIRNPLLVGELYVLGAYATDTPGEWRAYVRDHTGYLSHGRMWLDEAGMRIERMEMGVVSTTQVPGQSEWVRTGDAPTPAQPGSGTGNGGGETTSAVLLYKKDLSGEERSSQYFTVTVPVGAKKLVIETFSEDQWGRNQNDLFVSSGSKPKVTSHWPYQWSASCSSVNPNLEDEVCSFDNPAAGTWHILVYGYHAYYGTSLKVTVDP